VDVLYCNHCKKIQRTKNKHHSKKSVTKPFHSSNKGRMEKKEDTLAEKRGQNATHYRSHTCRLPNWV